MIIKKMIAFPFLIIFSILILAVVIPFILWLMFIYAIPLFFIGLWRGNLKELKETLSMFLKVPLEILCYIWRK